MNRAAVGWMTFLVGGGVLAAATVYALGYERTPPAARGRGPRVIPCTLATVERGRLELTTTLTGVVRPVRRARLGFDVVGTLATISVREGDRVAAGAPLAVLDPREKLAALAVAQAAHLRAQKELSLLEAGTRAEELERLRAQAAAAEADVVWTRGEVERMAPLVEGSVVTRSAYESMVSQRNSAQARFEAARAALRLAEAGSRAEELEVQRARVAEAQAAVARAQTEVDRTKLAAPFAGQVVRRLLAPGDPVAPGAAVLELLDVEGVEVELDVPARQAARLAPQASATLTVDEHHGFSVTLPVTAVLDESDAVSGSRRALVRVAPEQDAAGVLKPGTFVRARVALLPHEDVLIVPADAVRRTMDGWLLVKAAPTEAPPAGAGAGAAAPGGPPGGGHGAQGPPPPTAKFVPVRVIDQHGGRAAVEPLGVPLAPGERVVVVGADLAFEGAPLIELRQAPPAGAAAAPAKDGK